MITSQMVGPVAILDRAQKEIIAQLVARTSPNVVESANALIMLYHAEDYLLHKRK